MAKFMGTSFLLVVLLFVGVLVGLQLAHGNMKEMQGYEGPVDTVESEESKITSHDLDEKAKKLEEIKTFNTFSEAGNGIANLVESGFESTVDVVLERLIDVLAK
jgi:Protein of unknown function (DUF3679)